MDDGVSGVTPWCHAACAKSGSAFVTPDTNSYLYNARSELTNATAAVDTSYRYSYDFDDIGNRKTSSERGTNSVYTASQLNQYTAVDDFTPTYDADGNETIVKTATGIWNVFYNGENRPVRWTQGDTVITMSFDRMGRRVTKNDQRFVYYGYLQIADNSGNTYVWDPTESVATRPLVWVRSHDMAELSGDGSTLFYTHDGNKNVSEVIASDNDVAAHYEYAPFGALTVSRGESAVANPWRFSSEYAEDDTATVYYNYRHYEPMLGRWLQRDPIEERIDIKLYCFTCNCRSFSTDFLGLFDDGGYTECLDTQYIYDNIPSVGIVVREVCVAWGSYKKGHKDFTNNGTQCPFDYTEEDHNPFTSPFTPWGLWRHFRSLDDVLHNIQDLFEKPNCDAEMFQGLMHQLQDVFTHYNRSEEIFNVEVKWRWYTLGHLLGGTAPDLDDFAQEDAFDNAETMTKFMVELWKDNCVLCSEKSCKWKPNSKRKYNPGNFLELPRLKGK